MTENNENMLKTALEFASGVKKPEPFSIQGGREKILVPKGFSLLDVTDPDALPSRARAATVFDERADLIDYLNRFKQSSTVAFADIDKGEIRAVVDYHAPTDGKKTANPDLCAHHASLKLRESEEFKRWNAANGKLMAQEEFAYFLEENAVDISEPEPGQMIELARDIHGSHGAKFKSKIDFNSGDRTFHYETETKTNQTIKIPKKILLNIPIYQGEELVDLEMLFRYRVREGGVLLGVEWHRALYKRQAYFRQIATAIAEGAGVPVYMGRAQMLPKPGNYNDYDE